MIVSAARFVIYAEKRLVATIGLKMLWSLILRTYARLQQGQGWDVKVVDELKNAKLKST
jgi:hypothetical protein